MEIAEIKQTLWIQVPPKKILYPSKMYPFRVAADPWIARERETKWHLFVYYWDVHGTYSLDYNPNISRL